MSGESSKAIPEGFGKQTQLDFEIDFFDHILNKDPEYVDVLRCQGELLTRKGLHDRALEIDHRLVNLLPEDAIVRYNLACSLTLLGQLDEAILELGNALNFGYDDLDHLDADQDLDSLREVPAFQALISDYREKCNIS